MGTSIGWSVFVLQESAWIWMQSPLPGSFSKLKAETEVTERKTGAGQGGKALAWSPSQAGSGRASSPPWASSLLPRRSTEAIISGSPHPCSSRTLRRPPPALGLVPGLQSLPIGHGEHSLPGGCKLKLGPRHTHREPCPGPQSPESCPDLVGFVSIDYRLRRSHGLGSKMPGICPGVSGTTRGS